MEQLSKFHVKVDEGIFLGYSAISEAFMVFNMRKQVFEESIHVKFNEESYSKDSIDHLTSILDELISFSHFKSPKIDVPYVPSIPDLWSFITNPKHYSTPDPKSKLSIDLIYDPPRIETKVYIDEKSSMPDPNNF